MTVTGAGTSVEAVIAAARPHPLADQVPSSLRGILLEMAWDQDRLWTVPREPVGTELTTLRWHLGLPWWRAADGAWFRVRPTEVLARPDRFREHDARIDACVLMYPVHAVPRNGRLVVLDGIHRLARAEREQRTRVEVVVLTADDLAVIASPRRSTGVGARGNLDR